MADKGLTEAGRARAVKSLQKYVSGPRSIAAVACRPENVDKVRSLVEEAGVDIRIVTDPDAPGLYRTMSQSELEKLDAEHEAARQIRLVIHRPELARTIRIETGPEGTSIHLDG